MIHKIIDLYLYSSLHIAICAFVLTWSTYLIIDQIPDWNYCLFVGSSTWLLYNLHKLIGIHKVKDSRHENRFVLIRSYYRHIQVYTVLSAILSLYFFWQIEASIKTLIVLASIPSLSYVVPIFSKSNRLRDFQYIKIFIVATTWAFITGLIPLIEANIDPIFCIFFFLEKWFFIFAITLPFDYRDRLIDEDAQVKTLAHLLKDKIFLVIGLSFLSAMSLVVVNNLYSDMESLIVISIYLLIGAITFYASKKKNDYYFTGLIDGTMMLFGALYGIYFFYF